MPQTDSTPLPASLEPTAEFLGAARDLGIEFEPGDLERLGRFLSLLLEANKTTNLTAIKDPAQAWMKHIFDALTMVPVVTSVKEGSGQSAVGNGEAVIPPSSLHLSIIDIGSGGGVPALPLAIVMPDAKFTLVESTGKKADFLRFAIGRLGLKNARVISERAEKIGQDHKEHREQYDVAMARALGHLAIVVELCGPLVRPGGMVIAVKGAKAEQELGEAAKALGLIGLRHVETIATPTGRLVAMEKTIRTPRLYPRRDGEPARLPLGMPTEERKPKTRPESIC